jgi:hypothetical protein
MARQIGVLLEEQANVRQRACRHKPGSVRCGGHERSVHSFQMANIGSCWLDWLRKQGDSIQARLACMFSVYGRRTFDSVCTVYIGGVYSIAYDGLRRARVDLHVAPSDCFQYRSCIVRGLVKRSIAVDCAYAKQFDARIVCAEEEGICVLVLIVSNAWKR